jgi:CBS domain-containing protein
VISSLSSKKEFYVKNLIIDDEYASISSDKTVIDAALMMKEKEIPDLVVLDKDNQVLGVVSDHDITIMCVANGKDPKNTKVVESMYRIDPVGLETPVEVAFKRMQELKVSTVPVVENGKLKGVVTITDCWGYIPDKYEDYKGLLTVKDPKFANYWFTIFFSLIYFVFGILSPILGFAGFLHSKLSVSPNFKPTVTYYLFDAHGGDYFVRYLDFQSDGVSWFIISIYSFIFVLVGLLTTVMIIQWAYGDYKMIKSTKEWPKVPYILALVNMAIIWLLFLYMYMNGVVRTGEASFDFIGLYLSIFAVICLTLAVFRDFVFKSNQEVTN